MLYRILNEKIIPPKIRHIIWDVNGTITIGDIPDVEVCERIITLAKKDVHHSFITGRDRKWLQNFVSFLSKFEGFEKVVENLHFYPELGLMNWDPISGQVEVTDLIKGHPILDSKVRQKIAGLFYQDKNLKPYQGEEKPGYFIGGDANGNFFLIPENPEVEFPWFIWSSEKQIMGSAEVIRNPNTSLRKDCAEKIGQSAERLAVIFRNWGLGDLIKVSPVSTALNLVPIVSGFALNKDMAAGIALYRLAQRLKMNINQICSQTIAIGDGLADLQFATPIVGQIPICFVGPKTQLIPTAFQKEQIALLGEGAIVESGATGPKVTREVLQLLDSRIPPKRDIIYLRGKDGLEEFEEKERLRIGIERRIRHFIPEEDIQIHDAFLNPSLQGGHIHSDGYEAIMLEEGEIDAVVWADDDEQIRVYPLREWGDMIIFLPGSRHTLLVRKRSRIIVAKAHTVVFRPDQRQEVDLPGGMEILRQEMLAGKKPVEIILEEVKAKI